MSFEFFFQSFVTLLVIIDPIAVLPAFITLTKDDPKPIRVKIARKACLISSCLLVAFAFLGDTILDAMNISEPAFRIAGGILLLLTGIDMVISGSMTDKSQQKDEQKESMQKHDISVFPLSIPLISGPGSLVSIVVLMRQAEPFGLQTEIVIVSICIFVVFITYVCLVFSEKIIKVLGITGTNVLTRVFGIILTSVAIQGILNGLVVFIKGALN